MISLPLSGSHVVDDGVSPDIVHGIGLGNTKSWFADDDTELSLIVNRLGEFGVRIKLISIRDNGSEAFGENNGMSGLIDLVGTVEPRIVELFGMLGVVLAYTKDVSATDWRKDLSGRFCKRLSRSHNTRLANIDDLVETSQRCSGLK